MKKIITLLGLLLAASMLFVGCPGSAGNQPGSEEKGPTSDPAAPAEVVLWEGTVVSTWDGATAGKVEASKFSAIAAGGKLRIYGTANLAMQPKGTDWATTIPTIAADAANDTEHGNVYFDAKGVYEFTLAAGDVEALQSAGLLLFGGDVTFTKVTYIPAE